MSTSSSLKGSMGGKPTVKTISLLLAILFVFAVITYSFVSPKGIFSGLKNDLKSIEPTNEEFSYTDLDGNKILLSSVKGRPLIINSWATWMPFSKDELLMLSTIKKEYGADVEVVAINRKEDKDYIKAYLNEFGISRDIIFLVDPGDTFYTGIGGYAMPETVFYKEDGTIYKHVRGVITNEELKENTQNIFN